MSQSSTERTNLVCYFGRVHNLDSERFDLPFALVLRLLLIDVLPDIVDKVSESFFVFEQFGRWLAGPRCLPGEDIPNLRPVDDARLHFVRNTGKK